MAHGIETQALLDEMASGYKLKPEDIDTLLQRKVPEDLFLEYKSGEELNDKKKANQTMRQYLSGFANSMGGILILGIKEVKGSDWEISPPQNVDENLTEWASRALTEIGPYFSFPPQFYVVNHPHGDLLVAYTLRSSNLVPCKEKGHFVYYIRFHDQTLNNKTLQIPEYLISDLVLGRRNHPYLNIKNASLNLRADDFNIVRDGSLIKSRVIQFGVDLTIENESMLWADSVQIGAIRYIHAQGQSLSNHLTSYLNVQELFRSFWGNEEYNLIYSTIPRTLHLNPFSIETVNISGNTIPASIQQKLYKYTWQAAICLMSKNSPPSWYQIDLEINDKLLKAANANSTINPQENGDLIKIKRTSGYLPTVAWNGFGELEWG